MCTRVLQPGQYCRIPMTRIRVVKRRSYARRSDEETHHGPKIRFPPDAAPAERSLLNLGRVAIGIIVGSPPGR